LAAMASYGAAPTTATEAVEDPDLAVFRAELRRDKATRANVRAACACPSQQQQPQSQPMGTHAGGH
jgi:hypothetical protein